jgi:two-component system, NarL family, response regulator DevR
VTASPVKLLLVDDDPVERLGLTTLLGTAAHFSVVGEAGSVAEAILETRRCHPDVVLLDVRLPDGSGVDACREIRSERPTTRVLMLSAYDDEEAVITSILAGAAGYLLKHTVLDQLVEAVELVSRGGAMLDPAVTDAVLRWMRQAAAGSLDDPVAGLSGQERKILPLIAEGKTNREIAAALYLSEHTIKSYISSILHKLHLTRRAEVAAFMARRSSPEWTSSPPPNGGSHGAGWTA